LAVLPLFNYEPPTHPKMPNLPLFCSILGLPSHVKENLKAILTTPTMPASKPLTDLLDALSYDALRRIGSYLGVRLRGAKRHQKRAWVLAIADFWNDPLTAMAHWEKTPAEMHAAHARLLAAPGAPATLFLAEYGGLRALSQLHPPFSTAEHLFLSGLLHAVDGGAPHAAQRLCTPTLTITPSNAFPAAEVVDADDSGWSQLAPLTILHDLTQALAFLLQRPTLRLQHARWLSPSALRILNWRLAAPATLSAHSTHKQTTSLRTLWFLAVQANLIDAAQVTTTAWAWAALPPSAQLAALWNAWLGAGVTNAARLAYHQPDAAWDDAIRARCAAFLAQRTTPFTATDLANALLTDETLPVAFFIAHFTTLTDFDSALASLLDDIFYALGVVAVHPGARRSVTSTGRWLTAATPPPPLAWKTGATCAARWRAVDGDALCLRVTWDTAPHIQLALAQFSMEDATAPEADDLHDHHYCFTSASIAQAAARGASIALFWQMLTALDLPLHGAEALRLRQWWEEAVNPIRIALLPILRTRDAAQLAQLVQSAVVKPFLTEVISPTTAIVTGDIDALIVHLRGAGLPVANNTSSDPASPDDKGILWLAGQLFHYLGRYLPLPAPIDTHQLDQLFASQSAFQQAMLQSQLDRLVEHLADLLDNLPLTPPAAPSDPAQWQETINTAIERTQSLQITYFSAGRNLITRRRIDPYWLEEHRGLPYLRAYCHNADRVLTFRLDRIQRIEVL
jgi:hypothetical protein